MTAKPCTCNGTTFLWRHTRLKNGESVREAYPCPCQGGAWKVPGTEWVDAMPGRCGGRPALKGTRFDVRHVLDYLRSGSTVDSLAEGWSYIPRAAFEECVRLLDDPAWAGFDWGSPWLPKGARG